MGVYNVVESGTGNFKSRFHKSISYTKHFDLAFGRAVPVIEKFVLPGDVWRIGGEVLVRMLPMVSPSLTPMKLKVRYFFVPLRLLESNTELILTGSQDGHLYSGTLPKFKNFVADIDKVNYPNGYKVQKHGFWDYLGIPIGDYEAIKTDECLPAQYWNKAYKRIEWDYYFDENLNAEKGTYGDFNSYYDNLVAKKCANSGIFFVNLPKDYFTSALPWQLKGVAPAISVSGSGTFTPNYTRDWFINKTFPYGSDITGNSPDGYDVEPFATEATGQDLANLNMRFKNNLNQPQTVVINGVSFNGDDLRTMMSETRVFERLARCGSRYTEYLRSNFGISPADDTLQRAQYLGGWSIPILTTEVLQTAEDGSNPVGTMRGHGITRGGQRIQTFIAKEFGVILGIAHVLPKVQYTQGIKKELTYKNRFDFYNPSFQHLSEQEIRNGELYVSFTDGKNDDTFGFQAYANELRSSSDLVVGEMRDTLSYWNQAIKFNSRPNLNIAFINSTSYTANFNQCFANSGSSAYNIIVDFYNDLDVYRPMVRYSTPGLVDHL